MSPSLAFLTGVTDWWNALDTTARVFVIPGIAGGAVTLVLLFFTILGLDHGDLSSSLEIDVASDADVHADGSFFSTRSISGFFLGFGGVGYTVYEATDGNPYLASIAGLFAGCVMLYSIYFIGKSLLKLQSDGTVDISKAVGNSGTVYITIPPKRGAGGQVQVVFDNHHEVVHAVTDGDAPLLCGANVRVKEQLSNDLFLVEPI